jgi:hypothetical protein
VGQGLTEGVLRGRELLLELDDAVLQGVDLVLELEDLADALETDARGRQVE